MSNTPSSSSSKTPTVTVIGYGADSAVHDAVEIIVTCAATEHEPDVLARSSKLPQSLTDLSISKVTEYLATVESLLVKNSGITAAANIVRPFGTYTLTPVYSNQTISSGGLFGSSVTKTIISGYTCVWGMKVTISSDAANPDAAKTFAAVVDTLQTCPGVIVQQEKKKHQRTSSDDLNNMKHQVCNYSVAYTLTERQRVLLKEQARQAAVADAKRRAQELAAKLAASSPSEAYALGALKSLEEVDRGFEQGSDAGAACFRSAKQPQQGRALYLPTDSETARCSVVATFELLGPGDQQGVDDLTTASFEVGGASAASPSLTISLIRHSLVAGVKGDKGASAALQDLLGLQQKLLAALQLAPALLDPSSGVDGVTFSKIPQFNPISSEDSKLKGGFAAHSNVCIVVKDHDALSAAKKAGAVVERIYESRVDANQAAPTIEKITTDPEAKAAASDRARDQGVAAAWIRAQAYARDFDLELVGVQEMSEQDESAASAQNDSPRRAFVAQRQQQYNNVKSSSLSYFSSSNNYQSRPQVNATSDVVAWKCSATFAFKPKKV